MARGGAPCGTTGPDPANLSVSFSAKLSCPPDPGQPAIRQEPPGDKPDFRMTFRHFGPPALNSVDIPGGQVQYSRIEERARGPREGPVERRLFCGSSRADFPLYGPRESPQNRERGSWKRGNEVPLRLRRDRSPKAAALGTRSSLPALAAWPSWPRRPWHGDFGHAGVRRSPQVLTMAIWPSRAGPISGPIKSDHRTPAIGDSRATSVWGITTPFGYQCVASGVQFHRGAAQPLGPGTLSPCQEHSAPGKTQH